AARPPISTLFPYTTLFRSELNGFGVWFWGEKDYDAVQFRSDSRLLVVSGFPASEGEGDEPKSGLYYYEWTGTRLRLVKLVEKKRSEEHTSELQSLAYLVCR